MIKDKDIVIRVDPEIKGKIKKRAKSMGMSMSMYLRFLAIKDLKNNDQ